jgi:hypothetical protein
MTDGEWRIWQQPTIADNSGLRVTVISISYLGEWSDQTEPRGGRTTDGLSFIYKDGRQIIYPWANVVRAEYTPPTRNDPQ